MYVYDFITGAGCDLLAKPSEIMAVGGGGGMNKEFLKFSKSNSPPLASVI